MNNSGVDVTSIRAMVMENFIKTAKSKLKSNKKRLFSWKKH